VELTKIAEESARGGFSLIAGTAASTIISAVGVIVMARLLGPAGYGLYTLAFVLPGLFVAIADFGLSPALMRYGASLRSQRNYGKLAGMIGSGLLFELVVGVAASLLAFALSGQLATSVLRRQDMGPLVALASIMILSQGLFNLSSSTLVGLDRMGQGAMMMVLRDTARVILSPLLIIVGFGVAGAIGGQVFGWTLASVLGVLLLLAYRQGFRKMPSEIEPGKGVAADIETMMRYGGPLYVGALVSTVLAQYQNIVLAFFTSNTEIGNFSAAVNFGALIGIVATPVATALFPAFSKLDLQTRKEELQRMFDYSVKYTTLLIIPLAILVAALSEDLIRAVYGTAYSYAAIYLPLYVATFLLTGIGSQVVGNFLNGVGRTKETLKIILVQLAVFLPAAPIGAWLYRVPGLIVVSLLAGLVATAFGLKLATRKYEMHVNLKTSVAVLAAALVSVLPILPLVYYSLLPSLANVFLGGLIYLAAYLTLAPVFKAVKRTDLEILAPILGQIRILRPVTDLIFAYETRLLNMLERNISTTSRKPP
jgi:O-antigen/teichoic acid export membrane protein